MEGMDQISSPQQHPGADPEVDEKNYTGDTAPATAGTVVNTISTYCRGAFAVDSRSMRLEVVM